MHRINPPPRSILFILFILFILSYLLNFLREHCD